MSVSTDFRRSPSFSGDGDLWKHQNTENRTVHFKKRMERNAHKARRVAWIGWKSRVWGPVGSRGKWEDGRHRPSWSAGKPGRWRRCTSWKCMSRIKLDTNVQFPGYPNSIHFPTFIVLNSMHHSITLPLCKHRFRFRRNQPTHSGWSIAISLFACSSEVRITLMMFEMM